MDRVSFRRQLRRNATSAEVILWQALMNRQVKGQKFRRQHSIENYTVDFCCIEEKLVIEVDGHSHHNTGTQQADELRDKWLQEQGYKVLRVENYEVYSNVERVVWAIENMLAPSS